jgi:cytochrome c oxidase cbb3-type subunit 3
MRPQAVVLIVLTLAATACGALNKAPGRPSPDSVVIPPNQIMDFDLLYRKNCAACHGLDGKGGAAIALGDPVYLAIADDAAILRVTATGIAGTAMPAFAQSSGGMLTAKQIEAIIRGIRSGWAKPDILRDANPPPYAAKAQGDPKRGADVFAEYCSSCHGADGRGGPKASSIVDGSYLALVSDQNLRTNVIVGRPELGAPDWRGDIPGRPLSSGEVTDVVSWLASQRPEFPGQSFASAESIPGEVQ